MTRWRATAGLVIAAFAACISTSASASKADNSIRYANFVTPPNIDAYYNNLILGSLLADHIWDTLIHANSDTGAYEGNLATSWKWVGDTSIELELRQGVKFHNGARFDADDVVYTLNFVSNPANKALALGNVSWIARVEKLDKYKVRIVTKKPFPAAVAYLAHPRMAIYPHEYYAAVGPKGMNERPVGTGPYRVVEHAFGKYVRLERNRDYFRDGPKAKPTIDKVEVRFIPDLQTEVAETVAGGIDLISSGVSRDQAEQLRRVPDLQVVSGDTMAYSFLQLNTMPNTPAPQLLDIRVRQAIMYAIDRHVIAQFLAGENARVLETQCHPIQFACTDEGVSRYGYDPVRAKRLLAEAGFAKGFDIDLYASASERSRAEAVLGYLRNVGIRAHVRYLQGSFSALRSGKVPMFLVTSGNVIADASYAVSRFHEFSPDDLNKDPEVRDLLLLADSSLDVAVRKTSYTKAFKLIAERAYVLPMSSQPIYYVAARGLSFKPHTDGLPKFYEMSWK